MIEKNGKFYCDYQARYITEDIFIGMKYIIDISYKYNISIPKIKEIYNYFYSDTVNVTEVGLICESMFASDPLFNSATSSSPIEDSRAM